MLAAALCAAAGVPVFAQDAKLTPGAIASTNFNEVCASDGLPGSAYSRKHRVWRDKAGTLAKYGIPASEASQYEDDDRVPVCLGGDNASPLNHWPQLWPDARQKDDFEREVCRRVCNDRNLDLTVAQGWFMGDWRAHMKEFP